MKAAGFLDSPVPHGPPPKGISSARALPQVHEALNQNGPTSKAPSTQPVLPKKALQHQEEAFQQGSIEQKSLQGFQYSQHLHPSYHPPLQQLRHIHLVHRLQLSLNQAKNLQHRRHWSILYLNQLNRVLPTSKFARNFPEIQMGTLLFCCPVLPQLILPR